MPNDLISRSALLAAFQRALDDEWERRAVPKSGTCELMKAMEIVKKAPAVDAEPVRHGEWVEKQQMIAWCDDDVDVYYTCSVCEAGSPCEYPYCPNCGAKMDGKDTNVPTKAKDGGEQDAEQNTL